MKLKPVLTEKSLQKAKEGYYTFFVEKGLTKFQIKKLVNDLFGVHTKSVKTINYKGGKKKNIRGKTVTIKAAKKALVTLKKDEKIDIFEEKGK